MPIFFLNWNIGPDRERRHKDEREREREIGGRIIMFNHICEDIVVIKQKLMQGDLIEPRSRLSLINIT